MKKTTAAVLVALLARTASAAVDGSAILEHIRKQFSTPKDLKMSLGALAPSDMPGFLKGTITFSGKGPASHRDVHISENGRYYFLADVYRIGPSDIPGLKTAAPAPGAAAPPPIFFSPDGARFFIGTGIGRPQDAGLDPDAVHLAKIRLDGVFFRGSKKAKVALVEFSDLQCPYCKLAHEMLAANLEKKYGANIRWVSKHYPLRQTHPWAYDAAIAAVCAGMQSAEAHHAVEDAIFRDQASITMENLREKTFEYAQAAGLKKDAFMRCYDKREAAPKVDADIAEGDALGVNSTPTIFINGRKAGGIEFEELSTIIDEKLAEK